MQTATKGLQYTFRPIEHWPKEETPDRDRRRAPFKATYSATLKKLETELQHLGADIAVIQAAVDEGDVRKDGLLRAYARPRHSGIIVAFQSKHGWLQFACDCFDRWEANLRGIALTLERLRMADLYGVTKSGEQYRGWQALPGPATGDNSGPITKRSVAVRYLAAVLNCSIGDVEADPAAAIRRAERQTHPDGPSGDAKEFQRVQEAKGVLLGSQQASSSPRISA